MEINEIYDKIQLEELNLSVRSVNGLRRAKAYTIADVITLYNNGELFDTEKLGLKSIEEIRVAIETFDIDDYLRKNDMTKIEEESDTFSYENISIEEIIMPVRAYNALKRAGINTLAEAVERSESGELFQIRNIGIKTLEDIKIALDSFSIQKFQNSKHLNIEEKEIPVESTTTQIRIEEYFTLETLNRSVSDMHLSMRAINVLIRSGVRTVQEMLKMNNIEFLHMKNCGQTSYRQIREEIDKLYELKDTYFEKSNNGKQIEEFPLREVDSELVKILEKEYGFKTSWLMEWFNLSRQGIYNRLDKKINPGRWSGRKLLLDEYNVLDSMIKNKKYQTTVRDKNYYYLNNREDDGIFIIVSNIEIKAFFLEELPEKLACKIIDCKMNMLTEDEYTDAVAGRRVSILKDEFFIPSNMYTFNVCASRRNMSVDEYSKFLYGIPYSSNKQITDEKIIDFFENHLVNGTVAISSDPENQWIRSYVSRNGFSLADFVNLYGYDYANTTRDMSDSIFDRHQKLLKEFVVEKSNIIYLPTRNPVYTKLCLYANNNGMKLDEYIEKLGFIRTFNRTIELADFDESDMEVYPCDGGNLEKIYAKYPLIGSYIFGDKSFENLFQKTKQLIDKKLKENDFKFSTHAEMMIALVVVNCAKDWVSEENGKFWQYIALQFGFRDKGEQIRNILSNCLKNALETNNRWFYEDTNGYQYKSTAVIHALTTKKTWMTVCDLLFDFYANNLNWSYVEDDPLIEQMVNALKNKFDVFGESEEGILVSSKAYSFQEGVKKLILYRPKYAVVLFSRMINRIDQLISHTETKAKYYEEILCDEWMQQKISSISVKNHINADSDKREVVLDYDRIRPRFKLENETDIIITIPDVRLRKTDFERLEVRIFEESELLYSHSLSSYGSELGKTMVGFSLSMRKDFRFRSSNDKFFFRIQIICDGEELFDSGSTLYREFLIFDGKNEIGTTVCTHKSYTIFVPSGHEIECTNAEKVIINSTDTYSAFLLSLEDDFVISLDGNVLLIDSVKNSKLNIIAPKSPKNVEFIKNQNRYKVIEKDAVLHIVVPIADTIGKYYILINSIRVDMNCLQQEVKNDTVIYHLKLDRAGDEICIQIKNIAESKMVMQNFYKVIRTLDFYFNRNYYYSNNDYIDSFLQINRVGSLEALEVKFNKNDRCVFVPYMSGQLEFTVPKIRIIDTQNKEWNGQEKIWVKEISQDLFLNIVAPVGMEPLLFIDELQMEKEGNAYGLGNSVVKMNNGQRNKIRLSMKCNQQSYIIADIITKESFKEIPKLWVDNRKLLWNQGHGFIGNESEPIFAKIEFGNNKNEEYRIDFQNDTICEDVDFSIGEYRFLIVKKSVNVFVQEETILATGIFVIGNANELRFKNKNIIIDTLTFEKKVKSKVTGLEEYKYDSIPISTTYIDNIHFEGVKYVSSEDLECPIYTGTLFYYLHGERHEYSLKEGVSSKGFPVERINPVTLILLSENAMIINNPDGEGLYFYHYYDRNRDKTVCVLTDRVPDSYTESSYELTDLYSFRKEKC